MLLCTVKSLCVNGIIVQEPALHSYILGDPFMCIKSASQRLQMLKVIHVYEVSLTATSNIEMIHSIHVYKVSKTTTSYIHDMT